MSMLPPMISRGHLGTADLDRAVAFYGPLMAELGLALKFREADWAGWMREGVAQPALPDRHALRRQRRPSPATAR
jgi:hypothetical protein